MYLSKYKDKFLVGTGFNSLIETINLMKVATIFKSEQIFNNATCLLQIWR